MGLGQGTAKNRKILRKYIYQSTINGTITGDYTVAKVLFNIQPKILAPVHYKLTYLFKASIIQQELYPFPGG